MQHADWLMGAAIKIVIEYANGLMDSQLVSRLCSIGKVLILRVTGEFV